MQENRFQVFLDRQIESDLLPHTEAAQIGVIPFCPLASGLLTSKYLDGEVPPDGRAARAWTSGWVARTPREERRRILGGLHEIARARGQSLAQMALAWVLRHAGVVSALIGASRVEQIEDNVGALENLAFSPGEMARIDALTR